LLVFIEIRKSWSPQDVTDANDEKLINEQIRLLQNKQLPLQHAAQNQITVLNTTIAHMGNIETIIDRNEKLLQRQIMSI